MDVPPDSAAIHGITNAKLKGAPVFASIVSEFSNSSARRGSSSTMPSSTWASSRNCRALGFPKIPIARALDTVHLARKKFPGAPASLDALCSVSASTTRTERCTAPFSTPTCWPRSISN